MLETGVKSDPAFCFGQSIEKTNINFILTEEDFPLLSLVERKIILLFPEPSEFCLHFWVNNSFLDKLLVFLLSVDTLFLCL